MPTIRPGKVDPPHPQPKSYPGSRTLYTRAQRVIPGGIHLSGRPLVDADRSPLYFQRGAGCRLTDVDGRVYIDYLMAFGSVLLGYAQPEVEAAAYVQGRCGSLLSLNHPLHVKFVESLLLRFPAMEMGVFFRTGSEATTAALRVARAATGRCKVARCGYHGWHDWCLPHESYVPDGLAHQVLEFDANRPSTLAELLESEPRQFAAVILAPEMVLPHDPDKFRDIARIARRHGAVFIMDEVKTGMRIAPNSIYQRVGVIPDLLTVSKALGNGFAVAALLGQRPVMEAGSGIHFSATFHGDTAAMAAALVCLEMIEQRHVQSHVARLGQLLIDGLNGLARELDVPAEAYGEPLPAMPFFRFNANDAAVNQRLGDAFYTHILARGILLHPRHMWFISAAHDHADIARTLDAARSALLVARQLV